MRRRVKIRIPGTCGELIQSVYQGRECLVSLPIDCYNYVEAWLVDEESSENPFTRERNLELGLKGEKARQAFQMIANYLDLPESLVRRIRFRLSGDLKVGMGMASSTADVYGVMAATVSLMEKYLSPEVYGALCASIEPTDGIMFEEWTLFDHLKGETLGLKVEPELLEIYLFEAETAIDTIQMRSDRSYMEKLKRKTGLPINCFETYGATRQIETLGQAMTTSILENDPIVEKPGLQALVTLAQSMGAVGVVGAHSGSLLGLVFLKGQGPAESNLASDFHRVINAWQHDYQYINVHRHKSVKGGHTLLISEAI